MKSSAIISLVVSTVQAATGPQVAGYWRSNGGSSSTCQLAVAVAQAESGFNCLASNTQGNYPNDSTDRGLWQINDYWHPDVSNSCAYDCACNAKETVRISRGGSDWTPWAAYNSGAHNQYMSAAAGHCAAAFRGDLNATIEMTKRAQADDCASVVGGTCMPTSSCSTSTIPNLCPGSSANQCCVPSSSCSSQGGDCIDTYQGMSCGGSLLSGLCPGDSYIMCCMSSGGGGGGSGQMNAIHDVARADSIGKYPDGRCYEHVADYIDATGYGAIPVNGFNSMIPSAYWSYAYQFAEYANANLAKLGLTKLSLTNPYQAPKGAIVVVRAGTPGTSHPIAGDIAIATGGSNSVFYNGGEMGYGEIGRAHV